MRGSFVSLFLLLCSALHLSFAALDIGHAVYKLQDICQRRATAGEGDKRLTSLRQFVSGRRHFGNVLHVPWGKSVAVVLQKDGDGGGGGGNRLLTSDLDCRFTLKPPRPGANVTFAAKWWQMSSNCTNYLQIIYSSDMLLIHLVGSGTYAFTSALYLPVHVRTSVCKETNATAGLLIVATSSDGDQEEAASSILSMLSFVGPVLFLVLVVLLAALGCCVFLPFTCCHGGAATALGVTRARRNERTVTVSASVDKPPAYEELFPDGRAVGAGQPKPETEASPPPSYENIQRPEATLVAAVT